MRERVSKVLMAATVLALLGAPFLLDSQAFGIYDVSAKANENYGSDDNEEESEKESRPSQEAIDRNISVSITKNKSVESISLGDGIYHGGGSIGGGVSQVIGYGNFEKNFKASQAITGADSSQGQMTYAKVSTDMGPIAKGALQGAAITAGYIPGGIFNAEVGIFQSNEMKPVDKLNSPYTFDVYASAPMAGYKNGIMALLPDGSMKLLDDTVVDQTYFAEDSARWGGTGRLVLRTPYPKAVYMVVQVPVGR